MDEWASITGSQEIHDLRRVSVFIDSLAQGKRHHFRVRAGNMKDYGPPLITTPPAAIPSSKYGCFCSLVIFDVVYFPVFLFTVSYTVGFFVVYEGIYDKSFKTLNVCK